MDKDQNSQMPDSSAPIPPTATTPTSIVPPTQQITPDYTVQLSAEADMDKIVPHWLRLAVMLVPLATGLLGQLFTVGRFIQGLPSSLTSAISVLEAIAFLAAIYVGIRQHLFIRSKINAKVAKLIILLPLIMWGIIVAGMVIGSLMAINQFGKSILALPVIPLIALAGAITVFGSLPVLLAQYIYIKKNGKVFRLGVAYKVFTVLGFIISGAIAFFVAAIIISLSDPSTE